MTEATRPALLSNTVIVFESRLEANAFRVISGLTGIERAKEGTKLTPPLTDSEYLKFIEMTTAFSAGTEKEKLILAGSLGTMRSPSPSSPFSNALLTEKERPE
jgi:hypothetical protein